MKFWKKLLLLVKFLKLIIDIYRSLFRNEKPNE